MRRETGGSRSKRIFTGTVLKNHGVSYHRCAQCGLSQTEDPYWLEAAHPNVISGKGFGSVNRATTGSRNVEVVTLTCFDPNATRRIPYARADR